MWKTIWGAPLKTMGAVIAMAAIYLLLYGGSTFIAIAFIIWCLRHFGVLH